jgi:hypothetical protein
MIKNDKKKTTQRKNIDKEQFFTQHNTAKRLADFVKSQPWFDPEARIIEPAAGDGAWSDLFEDCLAYDIDPQKQGIVKADFLGLELDYIPKTISLGNPPFGRMGKLALQFIDKCSEISDYIAFILPASFGKATVKRRVPKDFHLIHQEEMLDETFRFERDGRKVATVFQVWERGTTERIDPPLIRECDDFSFVKNPEGADLAIRTHGSGYGLVFRDNFQDISPRTHRFIKAKAETPKLIAQRLEGIDYYQTAKFTTGAPCVATSEIFKLYLAEKTIS